MIKLQKRDQTLELEETRVIETFTKSPLYRDKFKGERLKLALFVTAPEPLGLDCRLPDLENFIKLESFWNNTR